jgi:hypothetical protein
VSGGGGGGRARGWVEGGSVAQRAPQQPVGIPQLFRHRHDLDLRAMAAVARRKSA